MRWRARGRCVYARRWRRGAQFAALHGIACVRPAWVAESLATGAPLGMDAYRQAPLSGTRVCVTGFMGVAGACATAGTPGA